jgi:hypothetical protein
MSLTGFIDVISPTMDAYQPQTSASIWADFMKKNHRYAFDAPQRKKMC